MKHRAPSARLVGNMADEEQVLVVKKLKVAELKKELSDRGLSTKGNKGELQARLQGYVLGDAEDEVEDNDVEDDLEHDLGDEVIKEDENEDDNEDEGKEEIAQEESTLDISLPENGESKEIKSPITSKSKTVAITPPTSEEDRRLQRLKRFGQQPSENDRKQARAQRFGIQSKESSKELKSSLPAETKGMDVEKLKKRAERFGAVSSVITKLEESDKLKRRKERFGIATAGGTSEMTEAKKKRAERFGI